MSKSSSSGIMAEAEAHQCVNARAGDFISKFRQQLHLQRLNSLLNYKEVLNHGGHVGTKSKAQCIHHFIRLPVADGLLENIEVPEASLPSGMQSCGFLHSDSNGSTSGVFYLFN
uniref:Uncharacterized protein n=1 Tax=Zea mays TaxID=4577 RepID=A0A804R924_MAIZE